MKQPKCYVNGREEQRGELARAREILVTAGIYRTLGNFGPFFPDKLKRYYQVIDTFEKEGFEFTIIESEVMSFSFDSMGMSKPYKQREAWYQPVINCR